VYAVILTRKTVVIRRTAGTFTCYCTSPSDCATGGHQEPNRLQIPNSRGCTDVKVVLIAQTRHDSHPTLVSVLPTQPPHPPRRHRFIRNCGEKYH
jgi:hypothetical protein